MPILDYWRGVWHRIVEYAVFEEFPPETAPLVERYADDAYRSCVYWFGPPKNAHKLYRVVQGERSLYCSNLGNPIIGISREITSKEKLCWTIAHEMYHRVTAGRRGIGKELWISEMMATLTSQWFLRNQGFKDHADALKEGVLASEGIVDVSLLRNTRNGLRRHIWSGAPIYPEEFSGSLWRMSYALEAVVKSSDLFTIIKARTLDDWVTSLPPEDQYAACRVLELPTENKTVPRNAREVQNFTNALQAKGDKKALIAALEHIVHLQPANDYAFFQLGYSYQIAKRLDDALTAYTKSRELGCLDKWLLYNIGSTYWQAENYALAAEWFQKAVDQTPDWAQAAYSLGQMLVKLGNIEAARQSWERVLTLSDEHYAKLAQKALNEHSLPLM